MAAFIVVAVIVVLIVSAILQCTLKRALAGWLLILFPLILCGAALINLARGQQNIGLAAYQSQRCQLVFGVLLFGLSLLAAFAPRWRWLYWAAWACNLLAVGILAWLVFAWTPFG